MSLLNEFFIFLGVNSHVYGWNVARLEFFPASRDTPMECVMSYNVCLYGQWSIFMAFLIILVDYLSCECAFGRWSGLKYYDVWWMHLLVKLNIWRCGVNCFTKLGQRVREIWSNNWSDLFVNSWQCREGSNVKLWNFS